MRGSYSYIDPNGDEVVVSWTADENGYRAESSVIPVAPAIPFPEQAAAVKAQIRFAQEERAAAAREAASAPAPAAYYKPTYSN